MDAVEVDGIVVKRDWDFSGGWGGGPSATWAGPPLRVLNKTGPLTVRKDGWRTRRMSRVRGLIFYHDGTLAFDTFRVAVEFANLDSPRYSTDERSSYRHDNGKFYIATGTYQHGGRVKRCVYQRGRDAQRQLFARRQRCLRPGAAARDRAGGGTGGGLITGVVVNATGAPSPTLKSAAKFVPPPSSASAERRPSLSQAGAVSSSSRFTGGVALKRLYVGGVEPSRIVRGRPGAEQTVANRDIPAGTFGLRVTRQKRAFFGLF